MKKGVMTDGAFCLFDAGSTSAEEIDAAVERFERLRLGSTCYRDNRIRAGGSFSFAGIWDALIWFERNLFGTTCLHDNLLRGNE